MTDFHEHAADIHDRFEEHLEIDVDEIAERLETLVEEYKVPLSEARRSVISHYLDEAGLERDAIGGDAEGPTPIAEIDAPEEWLTVEASVVELWEPRSDSVAQVGLLGDPTGTIKFTKWAKSDLPALEEGASYRLENVVTDEYQGRFSVKLNRTTKITQLDADVEVGRQTESIEGALVDMQQGSGLIKRCEVEGCTRVLQNGRCAEHGDVDGEFDLRIKGILDDGHETQDVLFDREATEAVSGIDLETATTMAKDALDTTVVADEIAERVLGRYYRIEGPTVGRYVLVEDVEELEAPEDTDELLIQARSI
ncbi:MAG: replication factor A [Halobacteriales archaeon]